MDQEEEQSLYRMASYAYMTQQPFDAEDAREAARESGERRVRAALLLGALAKQENINFEPADLEAKLAEIAETSGKHIAKVKAEYSEQKKREGLENELLEEKLLGHLRSIATIKEVSIEESKAASA